MRTCVNKHSRSIIYIYIYIHTYIQVHKHKQPTTDLQHFRHIRRRTWPARARTHVQQPYTRRSRRSRCSAIESLACYFPTQRDCPHELCGGEGAHFGPQDLYLRRVCEADGTSGFRERCYVLWCVCVCGCLCVQKSDASICACYSILVCVCACACACMLISCLCDTS